MSWYQGIMAVMGMFLVLTPVLLVRAIRRGEPYRVYEILIAGMALVWMVFQALAPAAAQRVPLWGHWAVRGVFIMLLANSFGFARWLFRRFERHEPPNAPPSYGPAQPGVWPPPPRV